MSSFAQHPADAASIATIRTLAADVVGKANSGHPGMLYTLTIYGLIHNNPYHQVPQWAWPQWPIFCLPGTTQSNPISLILYLFLF